MKAKNIHITGNKVTTEINGKLVEMTVDELIKMFKSGKILLDKESEIKLKEFIRKRNLRVLAAKAILIDSCETENDREYY